MGSGKTDLTAIELSLWPVDECLRVSEFETSQCPMAVKIDNRDPGLRVCLS